MSVYKKLQMARFALVQANLKKSGRNAFAKYEYFELGDFIPTVHKLFGEIGLCGIFNIDNEYAELVIIDTDMEDKFIRFRTPLVMASNPKGQAIQDLGSTHTYLRRYLWVMALEIVEHDVVDATTNPAEQAKVNEAKTESKDEQVAELMVDGMLSVGAQFKELSELTSLWKANQSKIDEMRKKHKSQYERLQSGFAEMKKQLEETV